MMAGSSRISPVRFSPPLERWLVALSDRWLRAHVAERCACGDAWNTLVAVGDLVRLRVEENALVRDRVLRDLAQGLRSRSRDRERDWVQGWSAADRDAAVALLRTRISELFETLSEAAADEDSWLDVLVERDELESVLALIAEADAADAVAEELVALDRVGETLATRRPPLSSEVPTRLVRACGASPLGWWVQGG